VKRIDFPRWKEVLAGTELPAGQKRSFEIAIQWYLSFCRRGRAEVNVQSARDFIAWAVEQKSPAPWQVEQWKEAIRWFFRESKSSGGDLSQGAPEERPVWLPAEKEEWPAWKRLFLTTVRRRNYSYRTEQSY
jgi:hypothetical protein